MLREQRPNSFGVAGGDPHTKTCRVQMADNASPKKPRAAKYCHCLHGHGATPTAGELSQKRAYQTRAGGVMQHRTGYSAAVEIA